MPHCRSLSDAAILATAFSLAEREQLLSASFSVENVKALFLEYEAAGADFQLRLKRQPWGARNFVVRDPDGNLILFAE